MNNNQKKKIVKKTVDKLEDFLCLSIAEDPHNFESIMQGIITELNKRYRQKGETKC